MSYSIIQADLKEHRNEIISLWKRNFQGVPEERYSWIYENNPSGETLCFLLRHDENDSIVGAASLFPRRILINGVYVNAAIGGDFAIDKKHRSLGQGLSLIKSFISTCEGEQFDLLYGFSNENSEPVTMKAGYVVLGEVIQMTTLLKSYHHIKKYINLPLIASATSSIIDSFILFRLIINYKKIKGLYSFEILSSFDDRFDDLWKKISNQFSFIGERTGSFLSWRFKESPYNKYDIFTLTSKDHHNIYGYIIFTVHEKRAQISDIGFLNDNKILDVLLNIFFRYQRQQGIESIAMSIGADPVLINQINKNGFSIRNRRGKIVIYISSKSSLSLQDVKKGNWYITSGDNDV
jgi:hypothetical protein